MSKCGITWMHSIGLLLILCCASVSGKVATLQDCSAPEFQTVLRAVPIGPLPATRAIWLTRQLAKWPGIEASGHFKLYYSASNQLWAAQGTRVRGADGALRLDVYPGSLPQSIAQRFKFVATGVVLAIKSPDLVKLSGLHQQQLLLVQEDNWGRVRQYSALQLAGALDDLYASAQAVADLGVSVRPGRTGFKLWAPTARRVSVCVYETGTGQAAALHKMRWNSANGIWSLVQGKDLSGHYYKYLVDVYVPGLGLVRNRVTDPYSISLSTDSKRSYIADLNHPALKPEGWNDSAQPSKVQVQTDMVVYELHVRDFSSNDHSVSAAHRGKYLAFTEGNSKGMKHLQALSAAGLTDVHLLPVFDFATVPEAACIAPVVPMAPPDSQAQQALIMESAADDCYNWGYDPYHFSAPEGSYATDAGNGATRILELRQMVLALHRADLRVGMDVVYNHTAASGQSEKSVLDRIVPGYYHRLDAAGRVERSTCCDNTATENLMMGKLMIDSAVLWATQYQIDSFRFDLMGHQPREVMQTLQTRVNQATGRTVNLIGEGWNFGEVADGARFVQASQGLLNGSGIGTFSDRSRDALRGGGAGESGMALIRNQGYLNGLVYDPNATTDPGTTASALLLAADLVRVGLAGSIQDYVLDSYLGVPKKLQQINYHGQSAGYVSQPGEVVNYVENHDNQTLFDINVYKLPVGTSHEDRVRVQMLGAAITALSQGVAYFHGGMEALRSKSMDGNSFDSGDWFNRLDWTFSDNYFATGLPPKGDNGKNYGLIQPLLSNPAIKPTPADIALARDMFFDLLKIRASTSLLRLRTADDIKARLKFYNTGASQNPVLLAAHLDGTNYPGARFRELVYFVNVDKYLHTVLLSTEKDKHYILHPVHLASNAADQRAARQARYDVSTGSFTVPARTATVYVVP